MRRSGREIPEAGLLGEADGRRSRSAATLRSRRVRYRAVLGESGMMYQAAMATMILGKPSTRKSARHGSTGPSCESLTITHARLLAKLVAKGAAAICIPTR